MSEKCEHCGARKDGRWETLSAGLCRALLKFYEIVKDNPRPVHLQKAGVFTKTEFTNFQKLRYFGLVNKGISPGYWTITEKGIRFLRGEVRVVKKAFVFRNRVQQVSDETISVKDALKQLPVWLERKDFAAEKAQAGLFEKNF